MILERIYLEEDVGRPLHQLPMHDTRRSCHAKHPVDPQPHKWIAYQNHKLLHYHILTNARREKRKHGWTLSGSLLRLTGAAAWGASVPAPKGGATSGSARAGMGWNEGGGTEGAMGTITAESRVEPPSNSPAESRVEGGRRLRPAGGGTPRASRRRRRCRWPVGSAGSAESAGTAASACRRRASPS